LFGEAPAKGGGIHVFRPGGNGSFRLNVASQTNDDKLKVTHLEREEHQFEDI
jgi:hypothetical protein